MFTFILKRIVQAIPVLLIVATLTFFMIRLAPGGLLVQKKMFQRKCWLISISTTG